MQDKEGTDVPTISLKQRIFTSPPSWVRYTDLHYLPHSCIQGKAGVDCVRGTSSCILLTRPLGTGHAAVGGYPAFFPAPPHPPHHPSPSHHYHTRPPNHTTSRSPRGRYTHSPVERKEELIVCAPLSRVESVKRPWVRVNQPLRGSRSQPVTLSIMTYNTLAQNLIEQNM